MEITLIKVLLPTAITFIFGIAITPLITSYLYKYQAWKKVSGKGMGYGGGATPVFDQLHKETDTNTPRMGGIVIWGSIFLTVISLAILGAIFPGTIFERLNFLSRSQSWLPLFALAIGALVGLIDDYLT